MHGVHSQFGDAALDLQGRGGRVLRRNRDHAGKTGRMLADGLRQLVVGQAGKRYGGGLVHHLHARCGQVNHLAVDATGVHVREPELVEIGQATHDVLRAFARAAHVEAHQTLEARIDVAFGQQLAVDIHHLGRRKRLFGGNTQVRRLERLLHGMGVGQWHGACVAAMGLGFRK